MADIIHLRIAGALLLLLAAAHVAFPRRFHWREELARLSPLNRQIFLVHCFFIVVVLVMMGVASLVYAPLLTRPDPLSRVALAGFALFWAMRLFVQWFIYDRKLWLGNTANTVVHVLFSLMWGYFVWVYGSTWWAQSV